MADPTALSHTTPLQRKTLSDIKNMACYAAGIDVASLTSDDTTIIVDLANAAVEYWRGFVLGMRGMSEQQQDYEWDGGGSLDPASGDTKFEMPDDYAGLKRIMVLNTDGSYEGQATVVHEDDYAASFAESTSNWENLTDIVCRLWQESTNNRRIVQVTPAPDDGDQFRVFYWALAEELADNADVIEAPANAHEGIILRVAWKFARLRGRREKADQLKADEAELLNEILGRPKREERRAPRARFFDEPAVNGYRGSRQGLPW